MEENMKNTVTENTETASVSAANVSEEPEGSEYVTFTTTKKDGTEIELAVVDEFEYDHKNYVVGALIEGDTINEDALYIYRSVLKGDDFSVEKITDAKLYEKLAKAYLEI